MPIIRIGPLTGLSTEGGVVHQFANGQGAQINKGAVVKPSNAVADTVVLTAVGDPDPVGVVYEDIPLGQTGWIVTRGIADVLVDNLGATALEAWLGVSAGTPGVCTSSAAPPGLVLQHFTEVGHTLASRAGPGLVRSILHWN